MKGVISPSVIRSALHGSGLVLNNERDLLTVNEIKDHFVATYSKFYTRKQSADSSSFEIPYFKEEVALLNEPSMSRQLGLIASTTNSHFVTQDVLQSDNKGLDKKRTSFEISEANTKTVEEACLKLMFPAVQSAALVLEAKVDS